MNLATQYTYFAFECGLKAQQSTICHFFLSNCVGRLSGRMLNLKMYFHFCAILDEQS